MAKNSLPPRRDKYRARITYEGKQVHLGYFSSPEEAHEAWKQAREDLGFFENHGEDR